MKLLEAFRDCQSLLKISAFVLLNTLGIGATVPVVAQDSSGGGGTIQTQLSHADLEALNRLVDIAQDNSPSVRDARDAMGITPFMDAVTIEIVPKDYTTNTSDASTGLPTYRYHESGVDFSATINPLYVIRGIQQQSALHSHLRDAKQQVRYAVIEDYIAYLQANRSAEMSQRQFDTVVASLLQTQVASIELQPGQVPNPNLLANNTEYVAAATDLFDANTNELMALEGLAVTVGMSSEETLILIETHQAASRQEPSQRQLASDQADIFFDDLSVQTTADLLNLPAVED